MALVDARGVAMRMRLPKPASKSRRRTAKLTPSFKSMEKGRWVHDLKEQGYTRAQILDLTGISKTHYHRLVDKVSTAIRDFRENRSGLQEAC